MALFLPQRWRLVPEYPVEVAPEWAGIVKFATLPGPYWRNDAVTHSLPAITSTITTVASVHGKVAAAATDARLSWPTLQPIPTFDAGYTLLTVAAPVATATVRRAITVGTPVSSAFNQIILGLNMGIGGGASSGTFALLEYNSTQRARAVSAASMVDGNWHVFAARRVAGASTSPEMYRDGTAVTSSTFNDASVATTAGIHIMGEPGGTQGAVDPHMMSVVFSRALTSDELYALRSPTLALQLFRPITPARIYSFPSGAIGSFKVAWAKNANGLILPYGT